jgi:hypothetical protein
MTDKFNKLHVNKLNVDKQACFKGDTMFSGDVTFNGETTFKDDVIFCGKLETKGEVVIKDLLAPKNVFIIGPSSSETGNLTAYYPAEVATYVPVNSKIRKLIRLFNGAEIALGPLNRHSEGLAMPDFLAKKMGYTLLNASDVTILPLGDCNIINYAVSGATAVGNNNNVPNNGTSPTWATTTGPHGYDSQVSLLLSHLSAVGRTPTKDDIVIYNGVGGNDIGAIALTNLIDGGPAAAAAIGQFLTTHIGNIQALYNVGFRHVYIDYLGANSLNYFPTAIKADVANPGTLAGLQATANILFLGPSGLQQLLANQAAATMPELHLSFNDVSAFAVDAFTNLSLYGTRLPLITDPDPRGPPAAAPFPTQLGILGINSNRCDANLLFIDDFHFTQHGQSLFSDHLCKFFLPWAKQ